jgi:autotransporter-associated beta strand protein
MKPLRTPHCLVLTSIALSLSAAFSGAQTVTWEGDVNTVWNTDGNWSGGAKPTASNTVLYNSTSANLAATLGANFSIAGLTIADTTTNVSIGALNTLAIGTGGIDMSSVNNGSNNFTISNAGITFNAASNITVATGRTLTLSGTSSTVTNGTVVLNGAGAVNATTATTVGNLTGQNSGLTVQSGTLTLTANITVGGAGTLSTGVGVFKNTGGTITQAANAIFVGQDGTGTFSQESGNSSFSSLRMAGSTGGNATLSVSGGNLAVTTWSSIIASGTSSQAHIILTGGTATLPVFPTTRGSGATADFKFDGGVLRPTVGSLTYMQANAFTNAWLTNNGAKIDTNAKDITIGQVLSDFSGANGTLTKQGLGTLTLSGENTYSGTTTVNGGVLSLTNSLAIKNSALDTANSVTGTVTAGLKTTQTALTFGGLTGNKDLASVFTTASGGYTAVTALTLNPGTGLTHTYSGAIANGAVGGMSLTKTGDGTQILTGTNSYTGVTNVNSGKLVINGSISTSSLTTVAVGATLGGSGTVGKTVINGTLAVGNSPGQMNFTDTLGLNGTTVMEIDGTLGAGVTDGHDFINLTGIGAAGVLTYGGAMTLDIGVIFGSGIYSWNLFDMASETGTFTSISLADLYSGSLLDGDLNGVWDLVSGDNTWQFTESTGVLDLAVVTIPEPNVAALLGGLGTLVLLRRRR